MVDRNEPDRNVAISEPICDLNLESSFADTTQGLTDMKLKDFICIQCGECCKHIDKVEGLKHLQENGICRYLKNNRCSIYAIRPQLCRKYSVYEMCKNILSETEFTQLAIDICEKLQREKKSNEYA